MSTGHYDDSYIIAANEVYINSRAIYGVNGFMGIIDGNTGNITVRSGSSTGSFSPGSYSGDKAPIWTDQDIYYYNSQNKWASSMVASEEPGVHIDVGKYRYVLAKSNADDTTFNKILDTSDATATNETIFLNETAYVNNTKVTGSFDYQSCVNMALTILGEQSLPYERLSYIESTGSQYLNTNVTPTHDLKYDIEVSNITSNDQPIFMGSYNWDANTCILSTQTDVFAWWYNFASGEGYQFGKGSLLDKNEISFYRKKVVFNGETVYNNTNTYPLYSGDDICLFGARSISNRRSKCRIHHFSITDMSSNTMLRDLIPVKMKETGEIGMYDLVNRSFYKSATGTSFIAGEVI